MDIDNKILLPITLDCCIAFRKGWLKSMQIKVTECDCIKIKYQIPSKTTPQRGNMTISLLAPSRYYLTNEIDYIRKTMVVS